MEDDNGMENDSEKCDGGFFNIQHVGNGDGTRTNGFMEINGLRATYDEVLKVKQTYGLSDNLIPPKNNMTST